MDQLVGHRGSACASLPSWLPSWRASCHWCSEILAVWRVGKGGHRYWWAVLGWTWGPVCSTGQRNTGLEHQLGQVIKGSLDPAQLSLPPPWSPARFWSTHYPPSSSNTEVYRPARRRKKSLEICSKTASGWGLGPALLRRRNHRASGSQWCLAAEFAPLGVRIPSKASCVLRGCPGKQRPSWTSGQVTGFSSSSVLSILPEYRRAGPSRNLVRPFLDEYNWSLERLNVFELLKSIF